MSQRSVVGPATLFDFSDPEQTGLWHPVNDVIMGGMSSSRLVQENGFAIFTGTVSLDQGGGFASVRTEDLSKSLAGLVGITLTVKGDGKTYKMNLTDDSRQRDILHQVRLSPTPGEWVHIMLPFTDFVPTWRGRVLERPVSLDLTSIRTFGLMIADKQEGPFALSVKTIQGFAEGGAPR